MIDRRVILTGLATTAFVPRIFAQTKAPTQNVGILNYATADDVRVRQFREAVEALGYAEGKTVQFRLRSANGNLERLPVLAAELVAAKVDVIIALGPATWAAKRATTVVPIVIAFSGDPVGDGMVASLARPGGNITGFSYMSSDLAAKRLELLSSAFSRSARIGVLYNPNEPATRRELAETEAASNKLGVSLLAIPVRQLAELEQAFQTAVADKADGLLVFTHGFAVLNRSRIIELADRHRVPVLYGWRDFVDEGGLMSYGPNIGSLVRSAAIYVDRILKGAQPADLPIQQPTKFELVINLKTAKALGLAVSSLLLAQADEVIE